MPYPRSVLIIHRLPSDTTQYGNPILVENDRTSTSAYREQTSPGTDQTAFGGGGVNDIAVTDWNYQFPAGPTVTIDDEIEDDGVVFQIIGDPELVQHPWSGADDHWELRCRRLRYVE